MSNTRARIPIAYILYGTSLFLLLFLVFFPYKRTAENLIAHFARKTGIGLAYKDLSYLFPLGCRFDHVEIQVPYQGVRYRIYKGEALDVRLSLLSLVRKRMDVRFLGKGYGGEASGEVSLRVPVKPESGRYHLQLKDLRVEEVLEPIYMRNFKIRGMLTGEAEVQFQGKDYYTSGTGMLVAALSHGRVRNILVKGITLPDFDYQTMQADVKLEGGKLRVENFLLESDILAAKIQGEIIINPENLRDSSLNLSARLRPMENDPVNLHGVAAFYERTLDREGYYPFELRGTFGFPELQ